MEIEKISQDKLTEILKKIYNLIYDEDTKSLIKNILDDKLLYVPNSDYIYINSGKWEHTSLLNVRSLVCELVLKNDLYSVVFEIDNDYESKIEKLSQLELIGLASKIRDKLTGCNKRTLHKITHSGQKNTPEMINKYGENIFIGKWTKSIKTIVQDTIIDILYVNPQLIKLIDNIEHNDMESYKNKILRSLTNILMDSNRLVNNQMDMFRLIMEKYDVSLNGLKNNGWLIDSVHDKYDNWIHRFEAYNKILNQGGKIFDIKIPSKKEYDFICNHNKKINDVFMKYSRQLMASQMGHEISNLQLKYQVYLNDKITQREKDKILKYLDKPPRSIEERNKFIRLLITNNVS